MTRAPLRLFTVSLVLFHTAALAAPLAGRGGPRDGGAEQAQGREGWRNRFQRDEIGTHPEDDGSRQPRDGGSVDTGKTTDGSTTTRDTTSTNDNGPSATHTGAVTKDDSDTVAYHGNSNTSTGKTSAAAGEVTKTDDGFVAHGAAAHNQGAVAGTVAKEGDQVYGHSVTTNGETVNRNWTNCSGNECTRTMVTAQAEQLPSYYLAPAYPCHGGAMVVTGEGGTAVYSCGVTPIVVTSMPLTATMIVADIDARTTQITSSPVVMYQVRDEDVVYVTSYAPKGVYSERVRDREYWVPGPSQASQQVTEDIALAAAQAAPTGNATVITYTIGKDLVYLTDQEPFEGIYSRGANDMHAWIAGVTKPTENQRDAIVTALIVHEKGGSLALVRAMQKQSAPALPPS